MAKWFNGDSKKTEVTGKERAQSNKVTAAGMKAGAEHARDDIERGQAPKAWPDGSKRL